MVPCHRALLIEEGGFVRHGDDFARVMALLPADPHLISGDPQNWCLTRDGGMVESIALNYRVICDLCKATWYEPTEGAVVGVFVRKQELRDDVRLLVKCLGQLIAGIACVTAASRSVRGRDFRILRFADVVAIRLAVFESQKRLFFHLKGFREIHEKRLDS